MANLGWKTSVPAHQPPPLASLGCRVIGAAERWLCESWGLSSISGDWKKRGVHHQVWACFNYSVQKNHLVVFEDHHSPGNEKLTLILPYHVLIQCLCEDRRAINHGNDQNQGRLSWEKAGVHHLSFIPQDCDVPESWWQRNSHSWCSSAVLEGSVLTKQCRTSPLGKQVGIQLFPPLGAQPVLLGASVISPWGSNGQCQRCSLETQTDLVFTKPLLSM